MIAPCYRCDRKAYLFADSRCAKCTRVEPDREPLDTPAVMAVNPEGGGFAIDFESDEPLVCDPNRPQGETCESCQ